MDSKIWWLVLALILGLMVIVLALFMMGDSGILPAPFPLMSN